MYVRTIDAAPYFTKFNGDAAKKRRNESYKARFTIKAAVKCNSKIKRSGIVVNVCELYFSDSRRSRGNGSR